MRLDNGDYPQRVRVCAEFSDLSAIRARQQKGEPEGQLVDIGFAAFAVVYCRRNSGATSPVWKRKSRATQLISAGVLRIRSGVTNAVFSTLAF
jgi:carbon-monoxide dehydrogenase large subunit